MYEKPVNLYFVSTIGQNMSLWNNLYRMKKSKDEDVTYFLMRVSQLRDHMQGLGEPITNSKVIICVLNALPLEWSSFATSIYSKKDSTPFIELQTQCILGESRIKVKDDIGSDDQSQSFLT